MSVTGKDSADILSLWKTQGPGGFLGITASITPNSFLLIGPNSVRFRFRISRIHYSILQLIAGFQGLGHNSILFVLECQMNYILQVLAEMMRLEAKVFEPTEAAEKRFKDEVEEQMKKMVWGKVDCGSWYADHRGVVTTLWPFSCLNYWKKTRRVDFNDFSFQ